MPPSSIMSRVAILLAIVAGSTRHSLGGDEIPSKPAERGYYWLTEKAYLPADFDQATFDLLWTVWPAPLRQQARTASLKERRDMAFKRYGLSTRPGDSSGKPLQYVVDAEGGWTMNCLACHGGKVNGQSIPGLPNANYELETLTEELRRTKLAHGKPLTRMDVGSLVMPLGSDKGLTNAVMFGVGLMSYRDAELNVVQTRPTARMVHHDMDPPPWWHFRKRSHIYIDGFAAKNARALMQFMLIPENGPDRFHAWESDFEDVYAFLESIEPPPYPFEIDRPLAREGQSLFEANCGECHGTYGLSETYPNRVVEIDEIGTDRVRFDALTVENRKRYGESWFGHYGNSTNVNEPRGYVAPPLDGIWATAPYFHHGAVPTLWDVLHPEDRPTVWKRESGGRPEDFDREHIGLVVERWESMPHLRLSNRSKRLYFDSTEFGKSNAGHTYPDSLTEKEKQAVLEYLKTL